MRLQAIGSAQKEGLARNRVVGYKAKIHFAGFVIKSLK